MRFQNWYKTHYDYEAQRKFHTNLGNLLEWLRKRTGDNHFLELKDLLEPPKRDSKKINPIILRENDIKNVIRKVWYSDYDSFNKLRLISAVLFASYTGQRPQATIAKITISELEEALNRRPTLLWIPEDKDKERFPHWVPIHPVLSKWLEAYISIAKDSNAKAFPYDPIRKALNDLNVKAIHTGRKIVFSHFRKFFEQMCNNVLGVHSGLRDNIMSHNTGSLDVQSYDGKLPSEIYEQYMIAWKDVNLVPDEVRLKELVKQILQSCDVI